MLEINIEDIKDKAYDIKEECPFKTEKVLICLRKYGQLKPVIVYLDSDGKYQLVNGSTLIKCLKQLEKKTVFAIDIGKRTFLEQVDICNLLDVSVRDINILKFANLLSQIEGMIDQQIADELSMKLKEVLVLKDLLKLEFNYNQNKRETQPGLFDESA